MYAIESPVSVGGGILLGMLTGSAPTVHKQWFMDNLHEGDKVLFNVKCDNHNRCTFILPNPDDPNKEYKTAGTFYPKVSKTNTSVLCGTGKLTADVEAQVCTKPETVKQPEVKNPEMSDCEITWPGLCRPTSVPANPPTTMLSPKQQEYLDLYTLLRFTALLRCRTAGIMAIAIQSGTKTKPSM